jgi:hypothetical protein
MTVEALAIQAISLPQTIPSILLSAAPEIYVFLYPFLPAYFHEQALASKKNGSCDTYN